MGLVDFGAWVGDVEFKDLGVWGLELRLVGSGAGIKTGAEWTTT